MKKILPPLLIVLMASGVWISCKHTPPEAPSVPGSGTPTPIPPTTPGTGTPSSLVCFEAEILPIFLSSCAKSNCHDANSARKGYVFDSYANITRKDIRPGNATNSKVYKVLFETGDDRMPQRPNPELTSTQKALIGRWINEGAQNTVNCGTACNANEFKFAANINPILQNNCVGCHGGTAPSGNINLTAYSSIYTVAISGRLYSAITHAPGYSPMPKNAAKLNDCQLEQIRKWVQAGALNN
jgi:hypothetical protein